MYVSDIVTEHMCHFQNGSDVTFLKVKQLLRISVVVASSQVAPDQTDCMIRGLTTLMDP